MANMQNPVELQLDTEEEKNAHLKTSWKSIVSEISAMNSATAQMVTIKPIQIILCLQCNLGPFALFLYHL